MLSPQSIREISNNDYRKAEPLLCNANLRICMQKDLSLTSLLGSSMGITFNFILKLEPLLTSQHSQSFLEGFQVFHWKLLLTGPAILSLLLPSCQTEKTNNWEVMGSLSQNQSTLVWLPCYPLFCSLLRSRSNLNANAVVAVVRPVY